MAVIGLLLVGPALHLWYGWLWRSIPGTSVAAIAKRLALDQVRACTCTCTCLCQLCTVVRVWLCVRAGSGLARCREYVRCVVHVRA